MQEIIERKRGSFNSLLFSMNVTAKGKLYSDVEDIFFVIKEAATDADVDAIMLKQMADGITIDANSQVTVPWGATEYDTFTIGKEYMLRLFAKFTGDPVADEDTDQEFTIKITQDFLHSS